MMRFLLAILVLAGVWACGEEETPGFATELRFSADTLLFDTVFSSVGSITKRFRVYNESPEDVIIPEIYLGNKGSSPYKVILGGEEGYEFGDFVLDRGDSALVLVSVTIDPQDQDLPYIVRDSLVFESDNNFWDVDLFAWGQDAWFLSDSVLSCNTTWSAGRPYVIYNSVLVDTLCTLTIEAGTRIYSHPGSGIFVKGTVLSSGTAENRVTFSNDRFDEDFINAAGQWEGLYFLEGSAGNLFEYTDIRNAELGLRVGTPDPDTDPDVVLNQVTIENMSSYGVLAFTSDISASNLLINNCRLGGFAGIAGGNYILQHATIANFPVSFLFDGPALVLSDNIILSNDELLEDDLFAQIENSVIWGPANDEVQLSETGNNLFVVVFERNLLRSPGSFPPSNFNEDPLFEDPQNYNYLPSQDSPLLNAGLELGVPQDLYGNSRSSPPDIGALERQN